MSNIDKRIVEMQFDNKQFESGVQTSIKSLDSLKKGLNLDASAKSLSNLADAGKRFSLEGIASGVDALAGKFTTMGIVGITAIQNLTNTAINAGTQIAKSLTIDPVKAGFDEYEQGLKAFQTILANTKLKGATIDDVNKTLAELNKYANLTTYSFGDMNTAMGLFTAQGVGLGQSLTSIKGIYNLVSMTGGDANKASSAVYQLSQAIASGTVKAMDWNSVINAGIGGDAFQQQIIMTAKTHGVAVEKMIKDQGGFKQSLEKGWLTSQILVESLSHFTGELSTEQLKSMGYSEAQIKQIQEVGKAALLAATQIKTLTQLKDIVLSNIVTGWATSFKIIVGDLEEATVLWSAIGNAIGEAFQRSTDARNAMLAFWKANDGRKDLIIGIANLFLGLGRIIDNIKGAFQEIFPPVTGQMLVDLTKNFRTLTENFKMGEEDANNLHRAFLGVAATIDMFGRVLLTIGKILMYVVQALMPFASGVLSISALLGDFMVSVDEANKSLLSFIGEGLAPIGAAFLDAFGYITGGPLTWLADKIRELTTGLNIGEVAVNSIKLAFAACFGIVGAATGSFQGMISYLKSLGGETVVAAAAVDEYGNSVDTASKKNSGFSTALGAFGESVKTTWDNTIENLKKFWASVSNFGKKIGDAFNSIGDASKNGFKDVSVDSIINTLTGGIFAAFLLELRKLTKTFSKKIPGLMDGITKVLDEVKNSLKGWQSELKSKSLINIAIALAILAGALFVLSRVQMKDLGAALGAMTGLFINLMIAMKVLTKIIDESDFKGMDKLIVGMIGLSVAVLILSHAMANLGGLDWNGVAKGLTVITVLIGSLILTAKLMNEKASMMISTSIALIAMSYAVSLLVGAIIKMSGLDWGQTLRGLLAITVLLGSIIALVRSVDGKKLISVATGMFIMSVALNIMAGALAILGNMQVTTLAIGLSAMAVGLSLIAIAMKEIPPNMLGSSLGVVAIAFALNIMAAAIAILGNMKIQTLTIGLSAMAVGLSLIAIAMKAIPPGMLGSSLGVLAIAVAMNVLISAIAILGNMKISTIIQGLLAISGVLLVLVTAMNFLQGSMGSAGAMILLAVALNLLIVPLMALGTMSLPAVGIALVAIAGSLLVLGLAAKFLQPLIPAMLGLSGALALIGVASGLIGVGVLAFASGLLMLAGASAAVIALIPVLAAAIAGAIVIMVEVLSSASDRIVKAVVNLAKSIIKSVTEIFPVIIGAITTFMLLLFPALEKLVPPLMKFLGVVMDNVLKFLIDQVPKVADAAEQIIIGLLQGLTKNIGGMVKAATDLMIAFINAIADNYLRIAQAGLDVLLKLMNGLADGIRNNAKLFSEAAVNIVDALTTAFMTIPNTFLECGAHVVNGLINGVKEGLGKVGAIGKAIGDALIGATNDAAGVASPSWKTYESGGHVISGLVNGMDDNKPKVANMATSIGQNLIDSLSAPITKDANKPAKAAEKAGSGAVAGAKKGTSGIKKVAENVKTQAEIIKDSLKSAVEALSAFSKNHQLNGELWAVTGGKNQTDVEKFKDNVQDLTVKQQDQKKVVDEVEASYKKMVSAYGATNVESVNLENQLMTEKIAYEKIGKEIEDVTKAQSERVRKAKEESIDLNNTLDDLDYKLWLSLNGKNATEVQKSNKELQNVVEDLATAQEKLNLATTDWEESNVKNGPEDKQTKEFLKTLKERKLAVSDLVNRVDELNKSNSSTLAKAKQDYSDYLIKNQAFLLSQGISQKDIEEAARKTSGYDPNAKAVSQNDVGTVIDSMKTAMDVAKNVYTEKAKEILDGLKVSFGEWGASYAESLGSGFLTAFDIVMEKIRMALDSMDKEIDIKLVAMSDKMNSMAADNGIRPVLDFSKLNVKAPTLNVSVPTNKAQSLSQTSNPKSQNGSTPSTESQPIVFQQYNYSPKALDRIDIYRDAFNLTRRVPT